MQLAPNPMASASCRREIVTGGGSTSWGAADGNVVICAADVLGPLDGYACGLLGGSGAGIPHRP